MDGVLSWRQPDPCRWRPGRPSARSTEQSQGAQQTLSQDASHSCACDGPIHEANLNLLNDNDYLFKEVQLLQAENQKLKSQIQVLHGMNPKIMLRSYKKQA